MTEYPTANTGCHYLLALHDSLIHNESEHQANLVEKMRRKTMITNSKKSLLLASLILSLTACGGGGGGSSSSAPPASPATVSSFPLLTGYKALVANGNSKSFTITGTCSGNGNKTVAALSGPTTFEGTPALSAVSTITMSFTNCTPASIATSITSYFDSNYIPLGSTIPNSTYSVYTTPPVIPANVSVGNTGLIGTETQYTNSTKAIVSGKIELSYVIEPDSPTTAIFNLISKNYNASNVLTATEQDRYRIDAQGVLTPLTDDIQYSNTSTAHLILTFN